MVKAGLNPNNWLVTKKLHDKLHIVHRYSGNERILKIGGCSNAG